jgi:hypothetical protein
MMALSLRLLEDSGMHAAMDKSDHVGALDAAARLIKANADVTDALVRAAQGETRHRLIVQQISLGAPGLNPNFSGTPRPSREETEAMRRRLVERINRMIDFRKSQGLPVDDEEGDDEGSISMTRSVRIKAARRAAIRIGWSTADTRARCANSAPACAPISAKRAHSSPK